jgi:hypothetical protein
MYGSFRGPVASGCLGGFSKVAKSYLKRVSGFRFEAKVTGTVGAKWKIREEMATI